MTMIDPTWFEKRTPRQQLAIVVGVLVLILLAVAFVMWLYSDDTLKQGELKGNIGVANGANAVVGNLVNNQNQVIKNAEINANKASDDLNASVNRPASQFDGNRANDRFCRNFPNDPGCRR